jgi:hypothetical protein
MNLPRKDNATNHAHVCWQQLMTPRSGGSSKHIPHCGFSEGAASGVSGIVDEFSGADSATGNSIGGEAVVAVSMSSVVDSGGVWDLESRVLRRVAMAGTIN